MVLFLLTPVCLAVPITLAYEVGTPREPVVRPVSVGPGYRAITGAYFGYAVPTSYHQDREWTDLDGNYFYGSPAHGWVAEAILARRRPPGPRTAPPTVFRFDAETRSTPYTLGRGHRIRVPGTSFAWEVGVTRPDGWHAVAVDTWLRGASTQMWLLVKAPPTVTAEVISSLRGA